MRLPLSWLDEYVKIDDIEPKELAEKLTRAGLQVETVESAGDEPLSDLIVVAEVLECEKHPGSDHLHVCKVTDGKETFQVVCGAPNMRKGIKTAFAKIGAPIPAFVGKNGKPEKIKKGKLRGVESFGMCCSEKELKIGEGADGIIEYADGVAAGTPVRELAGQAKQETVFDIEVTWNRPDALSVTGLAREFGAILGREVKMPPVDFAECETAAADEVKVVVENGAKCPRYTARVVLDVNDGPSPEIIAKRLELCGVRPLGLCVDVTNYVMLELGQPMHAFDHTKLKDRTIVVRDAKEGETIVTLDGIERKLDPSMLVICDTERPKAVAGIMGGEESGIAAGTKSVLLESALFDPASTKYTATKLGLSSESSYRYIRGVDKDIADFASRRAAHLLQKYGGAKIARGSVEADSREKPLNADVTLDFDRARRLIGIDIGNNEMAGILSRLGLEVRGGQRDFSSEKTATFGIPSWRWDLSLQADLAEEIARLHGLDNIPDAMPSAPSVSTLDQKQFAAKSRLRELCLALGFTEAMHYSFLAKKELDDFDRRNEAARLAIPDPVSAEYGMMRDSLLPQLMGSLGRNASHQAERPMLFEIGKVFSLADGKPSESERLSLGFAGPVAREALRRRAPLGEEEACLWMKGAVERIVERMHAGKVEFAPAVHPAFSVAAEIRINGRPAGVMGALSAKMRHPYRLTTQMVLCEMELGALLRRAGETGKVSAVPQYPSVFRDIAVAGSVPNETIVKTIRKNGGKELVGIDLFDVFKNSRAYSLEFRSAEKTLTDEEVGQTFRRIVDALKATAGIEVREG